MVAITRSAAARQQQSSIANNAVLPTAINKVRGTKKKKKIVKQRASSPTKSLSTSPIITTTAAAPELLDDMPSTTTSPTEAELCHHQNNHNTNDIIDDVEQCFELLSTSVNSISDNQQDNLCVPDENNELDTLSSWQVVVGEIELCKTNRGNDRICMCGFTYDLMSKSLTKNQRSFRYSRKNVGCRSVIYIYIDSNGYKVSNNAEHNHPPNNHHTKRLLILQKVKDKVLLEPTPITRIIEDEYVKSNLNNEDRCTL